MPGKAAGKAAKQEAAPPAASVKRTEELRRCGTCDEKKEKAEYTSSQWKKDTRQCKACAEAGPASDPKPEETAGAAPEEGLQADASVKS
ncbi:hypothetical protein DIPPA_10151 [Diplonema papillatum]|nr:hypothetical protein DIPPA_10151 [Diplonema papillatum]